MQRRRLRLPRRGAEAGAVLRVLSDGSGAHQRDRRRERACAPRSRNGVKRCVRAEHRQGGLSDQRHGHVQGDDGEGDGRQVAPVRSAASTVLCATRYGNVMASRGSVIPLFLDQIATGKPLTVTDPEHDALPDVARGIGGPGAVRVRARASLATSSCRRRPASTVGDLAQALRELIDERQRGPRSSARGTARSCTSRWCRARRWRVPRTGALLPHAGRLRATSTTTSISSRARRRSPSRGLHLAQHPAAGRGAGQGGADEPRCRARGACDA